jgi:two-component system, OmpR family, alkaline phosphatase synthesis response regulator PhoP
MAAKVLLVDDVRMFLELETNFLQRSAVTVLTARNGQEALKICRSERPSLVFMDLHMPIMDGADCCRAIKSEPMLRTTSVVLITSEGKEADRQTCVEANCDGFLTKPLDRQVFLDTARKLLPGFDRRDRRVSCRINTKYRAFGVSLSGVIADLSHKGLYLATEAELRKGTEIDLMFALPEPVGAIVEAKGRVAWANGRKERRKPSLPEGFGVELVYVSDEAAQATTRFIDSVPDPT